MLRRPGSPLEDPIPSPQVAIYGATGFTGRLTARALAARHLHVILVGRDRAKLEALAAELPAGTSIAIAGLDDPAALRGAFRRVDVVLSCAGPFGRHGRPVVDAALAEGRHYLDISGEIGFARDLLARDAEARARGVAVIGCVGLDVVPSDAAAVLACEALGASAVRDVRLTVASTAPPSRGSVRTLLSGLQSEAYAWSFVDGALVPTAIGAERWPVHLPAPFERCSATGFGLVESVLVPRSTGARTVRTGLALSAPGTLVAVARVLRGCARVPGLRSVVRAVADGVVRLVPEGGREDVRRASRFAVEARATAEDGDAATVVVTGGDANELTAAAAALCVDRVVRADRFPAGVLTPAQAFGARWLLDQLAPHGVSWSLTAPGVAGRPTARTR